MATLSFQVNSNNYSMKLDNFSLAWPEWLEVLCPCLTPPAA